MDARDPHDRTARRRIERLAVWLLAAMLVSGFWQAHGAWLFGGAAFRGH